jgi:hypothetical protein
MRSPDFWGAKQTRRTALLDFGGVEIWSLVGVCNLRANPPESDLKFQVGGVRQPNLRLRPRRENRLDTGVAEISLIFRCSAAVISLLFPLSFGEKSKYFN